MRISSSLSGLWQDLLPTYESSKVSPALSKPACPPVVKRFTLRINRVSTSSIDKLKSDLQTIIQGDPILSGRISDVVCHSLVPWKPSYCATVTFATTLKDDQLADRLNHCAGAGTGTRNPGYKFSVGFDGITPLYVRGDGSNVEADVLVVPGLGCHPLGSWKSRVNDSVWIRDFLGAEALNVRVLLYGYDTKLPGSLSKLSLSDLGKGLLEDIEAFRESRRPILLMGHSLGGIVIKEALVAARERVDNNEEDVQCAQVLKACYGAMFFGVPNLGLRNDQLGALVNGQPNQKMVECLLTDKDSEPSAYLSKLRNQFSGIGKGQLKILTFYERKVTPTLTLDNGKWRRDGEPCIMVTAESAHATGLRDPCDSGIPCNLDHRDLVKFDDADQKECGVAIRHLQDLLKETICRVGERFSKNSVPHPRSELVKECRESLAFENMDDRRDDIEPPISGTFNWLFDDEAWHQWHQEDHGLLWILGKPGSGKSTLLKHAFLRIPQLFGHSTLILSFFIHARGHNLQRTALGLFRAMLFQMLERPDAMSDLLQVFEQKQKKSRSDASWNSLVQLRSLFTSGLHEILKTRPVLMVMDAVDELGEQPARDLVSFFQEVIRQIPSVNCRCHIVFTCRHYPILSYGERANKLALDECNQDDIEIFVRSRLKPHPHLCAGVEKAIVRRAQGVFMWASLVSKRVIQSDHRGLSLLKIRKEVDAMPEQLEGIYKEIVMENMVPHNRMESLRLFQWACFFNKTVFHQFDLLSVLPWALAISNSDVTGHKTPTSIKEYETSGEVIPHALVERRVLHLSCGLLEAGWETGVQFIHGSARDFFLEHGLSILACPSNPSSVTQLESETSGHLHMALCCIQYLKLCKSRAEAPWEPLYRYAEESWAHHGKMCDSSPGIPDIILQALNWPDDQAVERWTLQWGPAKQRSLIHIACQNGLVNLLRRVLAISPDTKSLLNQALPDRDFTPLILASIGGHKEVVELLLGEPHVGVNALGRWHAYKPVGSYVEWARIPALGFAIMNGHENVVETFLRDERVRPNLRDPDRRETLLHKAATWGQAATANLLMRHSAVDVNAKGLDGQTPLHEAAETTINGGSSVQTLLESRDIDVNARNSNGWTPLHVAVSRGREPQLRVLLGASTIDINARSNNGTTPLQLAVYYQRESVVQLLLETDTVETNTRDRFGTSPLLEAIMSCNMEIISILLGCRKIDANAEHPRSSTALTNAVRQRDSTAVRDLLRKRRSVFWAFAHGADSLAKVLKQTQETRDLAGMDDAIYDATERSLLFDAQNVDAQNAYGQTLLTQALKEQDTRLAGLLLGQGKADLFLTDEMGSSPFLTTLHGMNSGFGRPVFWGVEAKWTWAHKMRIAGRPLLLHVNMCESTPRDLFNFVFDDCEADVDLMHDGVSPVLWQVAEAAAKLGVLKSRPGVVMPVQVEVAGSTITVEDEEAMGRLRKSMSRTRRIVRERDYIKWSEQWKFKSRVDMKVLLESFVEVLRCKGDARLWLQESWTTEGWCEKQRQHSIFRTPPVRV